MSVLPERYFLSDAESYSIGPDASWLICEEINSVHKSRSEPGRYDKAARGGNCSSGEPHPRPRGGSARGQCVGFWYTDAVHLDLPTRPNSSSNACLIQSEKVLNVNSSGRSRLPRCRRATTTQRSTNQKFFRKIRVLKREADNWMLSRRYHSCLAEAR